MSSQIIAFIRDGGGGSQFRYSGKSRPDTYVFVRGADRVFGHGFLCKFALSEWDKVAPDLLDQQLPIPVLIRVELDAADVDAKAVEGLVVQIGQLTAERDTFEAEIKRLAAELQKLEGIEATPGMTDEVKDFLRERDELLELLGPHAEPSDTPSQCLLRILSNLKTLREPLPPTPEPTIPLPVEHPPAILATPPPEIPKEKPAAKPPKAKKRQKATAAA